MAGLRKTRRTITAAHSILYRTVMRHHEFDRRSGLEKCPQVVTRQSHLRT